MITTEARLRQRDTSKAISGLAAVFDQPADLGEFVETIRSGAFTRTLRELPDVLMLHSHDRANVLARTTAGTLRLWEDREGLCFEAIDLITQLQFDALRDVQRGNLAHMSFGFIVRRDDWTVRNGRPYREVIDVSLQEISLVSMPAYKQTSAVAGSASQLIELPQRQQPGRSAMLWRDKQQLAKADSRRRWLRIAELQFQLQRH